VTALVACLPVAVLGMGAALAHLVHDNTPDPARSTPDTTPDTGTGPSQASTPPEAIPDPDSTRQDHPSRPATTASTPRPAKTGKPGAGPDTAARVAELHARHPDITRTEIARRLGLSERTVRRHLNTPATDPTTSEPGDYASQAA
jgi:hypothetical protein